MSVVDLPSRQCCGVMALQIVPAADGQHLLYLLCFRDILYGVFLADCHDFPSAFIDNTVLTVLTVHIATK